MAARDARDLDSGLPLLRVQSQAGYIYLKMIELASLSSGARAIVSKSGLTLREKQALNGIQSYKFDENGLPTKDGALNRRLIITPTIEKTLDMQPVQLAELKAGQDDLIKDIEELQAEIRRSESLSRQWIQIRPAWTQGQVETISGALNTLALAEAGCSRALDALSDAQMQTDLSLIDLKADKSEQR